MNVGHAIIKLRKEKNLSQEQLAFDSGISRHFMYRIENNLKLVNSLSIKPSAIFVAAEKSQFIPYPFDISLILNQSFNQTVQGKTRFIYIEKPTIKKIFT